MAVSHVLGLAAVLLLVGCGPGSDGDSGTIDGGGSDTGGLDANRLDASNIDVGSPEDVGGNDAPTDGSMAIDASLDTAVRPDAYCANASTTEVCNAFDDDCDGRVDEAACGNCTSRVGPNNTNYLFCSRAIYGVDAWAGGCESLGNGYRLVDLDTAGETLFVANEIGPMPRWVGLRRFGLASPELTDSNLRRRQLSEFELNPDDTVLMDEGCVTFANTGLRSELCDGLFGARQGWICEAPIRFTAPVPADETCNGVDDNFNGRVDEGVCLDGCAVVRFAGHNYFRCDSELDYDAAQASCLGRGASLVTIESLGENRFVSVKLRAPLGVTWLGASDDPARAMNATAGEYHWLDGRILSAGYTNWRSGSPGTPTPTERCMAMNTTGAGDLWIDTTCTRPATYICEVGDTVGP